MGTYVISKSQRKDKQCQQMAILFTRLVLQFWHQGLTSVLPEWSACSVLIVGRGHPMVLKPSSQWVPDEQRQTAPRFSLTIFNKTRRQDTFNIIFRVGGKKTKSYFWLCACNCKARNAHLLHSPLSMK